MRIHYQAGNARYLCEVGKRDGRSVYYTASNAPASCAKCLTIARGNMIEMRFISNCPTHAAVWEVMEYEREGNATFEKMRDAGQIFQDLTGQWWHAWISFFTTLEKAREYAGKSQTGSYFDTVVFDLA